MPWPPPIRRHFWRCSSVASIRRGNHKSGAANSRPSAKVTIRRSSVTTTSMAVESSLTTEMDIPGLHKAQSMLKDERPQPIQLVSSKPMGLCDPNRVQPELCDPIAVLDVDVHRFRSLKAVKKEA